MAHAGKTLQTRTCTPGETQKATDGLRYALIKRSDLEGKKTDMFSVALVFY